MTKIIKLHGCSGAGKTTVARAVMASASTVHSVTPDGAKRPEAYCCIWNDQPAPLIILGSYENNCGGMDSYPSDAESIIRLIDEYHSVGHILMEGLLMSTYYGAVGKHLETMGDDAIFAFLDTPILTCLERITHRRDVMKSKNKFNPQNTIDKYNTIAQLKKKCEQNGRRVVTFKYDADPVGQVRSLIYDAS